MKRTQTGSRKKVKIPPPPHSVFEVDHLDSHQYLKRCAYMLLKAFQMSDYIQTIAMHASHQTCLKLRTESAEVVCPEHSGLQPEEAMFYC